MLADHMERSMAMNQEKLRSESTGRSDGRLVRLRAVLQVVGVVITMSVVALGTDRSPGAILVGTIVVAVLVVIISRMGDVASQRRTAGAKFFERIAGVVVVIIVAGLLLAIFFQWPPFLYDVIRPKKPFFEFRDVTFSVVGDSGNPSVDLVSDNANPVQVTRRFYAGRGNVPHEVFDVPRGYRVTHRFIRVLRAEWGAPQQNLQDYWLGGYITFNGVNTNETDSADGWSSIEVYPQLLLGEHRPVAGNSIRFQVFLVLEPKWN